MKKLSKEIFIDILSTPKKTVLISHINPDGDAVGSMLGLSNLLSQKNFDVSNITPNDFPDFLQWLPGSSNIEIFNKNQKECIRLINEAELIFCLDFNAPHRTGEIEKHLIESKAIKILIDHHPQPADFCDYGVSITKKSSTAEIVYDVIKSSGNEDLINKEIAECLYLGIMTDTGSFSYSCDSPEVYITIGELVKKGINCSEVHHLTYNTFTENRMRLLGHCLTEGFKVYHTCSTAIIFVSNEVKKRLNFQVGDSEGIVNYALSIKGINFAAIFMEQKDCIKLSFRSIGTFSTNEFARNHFNGGGHKNASGGKYHGSMEEALAFFESLIIEQKNEIINS